MNKFEALKLIKNYFNDPNSNFPPNSTISVSEVFLFLPNTIDTYHTNVQYLTSCKEIASIQIATVFEDRYIDFLGFPDPAFIPADDYQDILETINYINYGLKDTFGRLYLDIENVNDDCLDIAYSVRIPYRFFKYSPRQFLDDIISSILETFTVYGTLLYSVSSGELNFNEAKKLIDNMFS